MMFDNVLLLFLLPTISMSLSFGTISQTQLVGVGSTNQWLFNQTLWSNCMCQAKGYNSPSVIAFNYFFNNKTCQLFFENSSSLLSSSKSFYLNSMDDSKVYILSTNFTNYLTSICCADLSWLIKTIQQSNTFRSTSTTFPLALTLNSDLKELALIIWPNRTSFSMERRLTTNNMTRTGYSFARSNARSIIYHNNQYYVGINRTTSTVSNIYVPYTSTFSGLDDLSIKRGNPQRAVWLFNNTIMCVIVELENNSTLQFLNWFETTMNFTKNRTITIPFERPYALAKSNDETMLYIGGQTATIYQFSTINFTWTRFISNDNSSEKVMTLIVDSCGYRLWTLMLGFGIRIYDRLTGSELYSWNMSDIYPTLYDMILTNDYELYFIDLTMNQLVHYGLSLKQQCNIN